MKKHLLTTTSLFIISILLCQAQTPALWGMTEGSLFSYNITKNTETVLDSADWFLTSGSLIQTNNGLLYGMTRMEGVYSRGMIFSYNILTDSYTDIYDFGSSDTDGVEPRGSLIQASNGLLYGMTSDGGTNYSFGTIFSYSISTGNYTVLYSFGNRVNDGIIPLGSLLQVSDSLLYGMTYAGGTNDSGTIFNYNILTDSETVVYNFGSSDTDGAYPYGSLLQASGGLLYGMTSAGGTMDSGVIFNYNSSTDKENVLHNFKGYPVDGKQPHGSLIRVGDSLLYGLTVAGGIEDYYGTIFSCNISTGKETVLHTFGSGTDGINPLGSLIQASNGLLYGMTYWGGTLGVGTIFSYSISTHTESDIVNFSGNEDLPYGDLLEVDTPATGINQLTINTNQFSIFPNPTSGQFTIKLNSNQTNYTLAVYNVMGEQVYQSVLKSPLEDLGVINLSTQPDGMYFIYLKSDEGVEVGKVMVTK